MDRIDASGRLWRTPQDVCLFVSDFGGEGVPVVMLHGLAGHCGEWAQVANLLPSNLHPIAFDQRGCGRSDRDPADLSRNAHVEDVVSVIDEFGRGEAVGLVGQSLGANTAFLVAARCPERVRALVVIEGAPSQNEPNAVRRIAQWLESWPRPFASRSMAVDFFGGGRRGEVWADGLEARSDGLWPQFNDKVMLDALLPLQSRAWWAEWEAIRCQALVVVGEHGWIEPVDAARMVERQPNATIASVADAGHDVHLDQPEALAGLLGEWLTAACSDYRA